jgi:hypothetical protein
MHLALDQMRKNFLESVGLTIEFNFVYLAVAPFVYILLFIPLLGKVHMNIDQKIYNEITIFLIYSSLLEVCYRHSYI